MGSNFLNHVTQQAQIFFTRLHGTVTTWIVSLWKSPKPWLTSVCYNSLITHFGNTTPSPQKQAKQKIYMEDLKFIKCRIWPDLVITCSLPYNSSACFCLCSKILHLWCEAWLSAVIPRAHIDSFAKMQFLASVSASQSIQPKESTLKWCCTEPCKLYLAYCAHSEDSTGASNQRDVIGCAMSHRLCR